MTIMADIRTYLAGESTVTDRVGNRIFPQYRPQRTTLPAIVYGWLGDSPLRQMGDVQTMQGGLFEIDCISESYEGAATLANAVLDVLDGHVATGIRGVFFSTSADIYEQPTDASDKGIFRRVLNFDIWFDRSSS